MSQGGSRNKMNNQLKYSHKKEIEYYSKDSFDFCIIGSGASGSILAYRLSNFGYKVLVLECGPFVEKETTYSQILESQEPAYVQNDVGSWVLNGYPWTTSNVGGGTVFYGGASFRYREQDFDSSAYTISELDVKWPYNYHDLLHYYQETEKLIGVSGCINNDFTAPPFYKLPLPPIPTSEEGEFIKTGAQSLGLHPFPTPMSILSQDYNGRKKCETLTPCISYACPKNAKADLYHTLLKPSILKGNLTVLSGLKALKLERSKENKVDSVLVKLINRKLLLRFRSDYFILCCNAVQTAALLLRSRDKWSKQGIGNNSGMVGRGFCQKLSKYIIGVRKTKKKGLRTYLGPFSTVAITDYYYDPKVPTGLGGLIYESRFNFPLNGDSEYATLRLECILADTPTLENRVFLQESEDPLTSSIMMQYRTHPVDRVRLDYIVEYAKEILYASGCSHVYEESSGYELGSTHFHGTCRYHLSDSQGVVDRNSKVYGVDNLYIGDGSFMPFPGSLNPTLTIQAHALKLGDHLKGLIK
jgi:choline dehydrogenase-like flavoprotein